MMSSVTLTSSLTLMPHVILTSLCHTFCVAMEMVLELARLGVMKTVCKLLNEEWAKSSSHDMYHVIRLPW